MTESSLVLTVEDQPNPQDCALVHRELTAFNVAIAGGDGYRPLAAFFRDDSDEIVAGLVAATFYRWLVVELLWVSETHRGRSLGSRLLSAAEQEAINRGCTGAFLDTLSFQAPGFYETQGYRPFGTLEGLPPGHTRIYMTKHFASSSI